MKKLFFITGASGTGKTTAVNILEEKHINGVVFCYFDSIGVPSMEDMIAQYGNGDEWQKQETINWVKKIKTDYLSTHTVVLDGQVRPSFIDEACTAVGITEYEIIVFVCDDEARNKRLIERGHPELVNQDMNNWNNYLKAQALERRDTIIDTTNFEIGQATEKLSSIIT